MGYVSCDTYPLASGLVDHADAERLGVPLRRPLAGLFATKHVRRLHARDDRYDLHTAVVLRQYARSPDHLRFRAEMLLHVLAYRVDLFQLQIVAAYDLHYRTVASGYVRL